MKKILALLSLVILISCSKSVTSEEMKSQSENYQNVAMPDSQYAIIYVIRAPHSFDFIRFGRPFKVYVDDANEYNRIGDNKPKNYIYFYLSPGTYKILSQAENLDEIIINPKPHEVIYIKQESRIGTTTLKNSLKIIDETEAKYLMKNSQIGINKSNIFYK